MKLLKEKGKIDVNYLRSLILYTLIIIFILLCSVLIFLMFINIYHHYKFPEIQSLNHYRHNQWYHHNQQQKPDGIIMNVLTKQIDQQTSTLSTTIGSPTGSSSTDLITKTQGIVIKPYMEQGVESYVQSVLESTFKTTKELIDRKRNPAII